MFFKCDADLSRCPESLFSEAKHVCIGDLHGNTLKLLYFLIEENILLLTEEDYIALRNIYRIDPRYLTLDDLNLFKLIIYNAKVNTTRSVTLLGDDLADRGQNDYFTLLVLRKLHEANVNVEILLSNHGMAFLKYYYGSNLNEIGIGGSFIESLANMDFLVNEGLIHRDEINNIVNKCYIPKLRAFSYSLSPVNELTLYSHAPVGLETVRELIEMVNNILIDEIDSDDEFIDAPFFDKTLLAMHLNYNDDTIENLMRAIDELNKIVSNSLFHEKFLLRLGYENINHNCNLSVPIPLKYPLLRLIWNRLVGTELIIHTSKNIIINFVHGHVGRKSIRYEPGIITSHENLDTDLGKHPTLFKTKNLDSQYCIRISNDIGSQQLRANEQNINKSCALIEGTFFNLTNRKDTRDLSSVDKEDRSQITKEPSNSEQEYNEELSVIFKN